MKTSLHSISTLRRLPIPAAIARGFTAASLLAPGLVLANPTGGTVVGGHATISTPSSNGMVITETTNSAAINWQTFNIATGQYVQFVQPSSSSVVLNRVIGGTPSEIFGSLLANGKVFLINPYGVLFGPGARIDVGGLLATTMNISDQDFMSGRYVFSGSGAPGAGVTNAGAITAAPGGFVVLAGDYVHNTGVIQAQLGQVVLASGSAMTMDLAGDGLVSFTVDQAALSQHAGVDNAGQLLADGGRVLMTARTARDLLGSAVNNSGLVRAQGIADHSGQIELTASGGNIADSGTLDASNANGAGGAGGDIKVSGDQDIDIQKGAQLLANGTSGGQVHVVADGVLNTRAGSLIEALGSQGPGGFTELSGHGLLRMRGDVKLGRGGTLLIDPPAIVVKAGAPTDSSGSSSATIFQNTLQSDLASGMSVQLVASSSITIDTLNGNVLDGTNAGGGGGLLLGIGTATTGIGANDGTFSQGTGGGAISFQPPGTDSIKVDGNLQLESGTGSGTITAGNLTSTQKSITVSGGGNIATGDLNALNNISVAATHGAIVTGNVQGSSIELSSGGTTDLGSDHGVGIHTGSLIATNGFINVLASAGNIEVGSLTANNSGSSATSAFLDAQNGGVSINGAINLINGLRAVGGPPILNQGKASRLTVIAGNGDINLRGSVTVDGGGGSSSGCIGACASVNNNSPFSMASVSLNASNGKVEVSGPMTVAARAFHLTSGSNSVSRGDASISIFAHGNIVHFASSVSLSAVGIANFNLQGTNAIILDSPVAVSASRASSISHPAGATVTSDVGGALIQLSANNAGEVTPNTSTVTTNGLSATGPNAAVLVRGGSLTLNNGTGGKAVTATAFTGGSSDGGQGDYYRYQASGSASPANNVTSNFGLGAIVLQAVGTQAGASGLVSGGLVVSGPAALAVITSRGTVNLSGGVAVTGLGYTNQGNSNTLPFSNFASSIGFSVPKEMLPPIQLNSGTTTFGTARLNINGASSSGGTATAPAGSVGITGGITVAGIGAAGVLVYAGGLNVAGGLSVTATKGSLQGTQTSTVNLGGNSYSVTRTISNGSSGAATTGQAGANLQISGNGSLQLDSLTVQGLTAEASVISGGAVSVTGKVTVAGATGINAPVYNELATFTPIGNAPAMSSAQTNVVGGKNFFGVDFDTEALASSFSAGGVSVSGSGFVGIGINAGTVSFGALSLNQETGSFFSNDPTRGSYNINNPGAALFINNGSGNPAQGASITVSASGPLAIALKTQLTGSFSGSARSLTGALSGALLGFQDPVSQGIPTGLATGGTPSNLNGAGLNVNAAGIGLSFSSTSNLHALSLVSSGKLTLGGSGATLTVNSGTVTLNGANVSLSSVGLNAPAISVHGTAVSINGSTLNASTIGVTTTTGDIKVSNSDLNASSIALNAHGNITLSGATFDGSGGPVVLTALGSISAGSPIVNTGGLTRQPTSGSPSSTIRAGSLSVQGGSINLSNASLTIGSGHASFGADPKLISALQQIDPAILPPSTAPNASFSAPGGVTLGRISIAGGYLYIQAPTLNLPTVVSVPVLSAARGLARAATSAPGLFIDFQPTQNNTTLFFNQGQPPTGINTIVFGGSNQHGPILIGNGFNNFNYTGAPNFVFDSSGITFYPDKISTNGRVIVLGPEVPSTVAINGLPLTPTDLNPDQPPPSVLDPTGNPGNVNDPGVNDDNRGLIDSDTSAPLACGVGGTQ